VNVITFTVHGRPEPQGSSKAFIIGGKARITSANSKMKPFRSEVTRCALWEMNAQGVEFFGKHVPVRLTLTFIFRKPDSVPKNRTHCVVKPDLDKLTRTINDALTGAVWHDDSQVVETSARKTYGPIEGVNITVSEVTGY
jgi:Holliday junction resolvase RusA-like endonuclease